MDAALGTIPARAGSRAGVARFPGLFGDHPRAYREQGRIDQDGNLIMGPSPRVRGAERVLGELLHVQGTIPACTGSSPGCRCRPRPCWDHPRTCGGAVRLLAVVRHVVGTIPERTGSTRSRPS